MIVIFSKCRAIKTFMQTFAFSVRIKKVKFKRFVKIFYGINFNNGCISQPVEKFEPVEELEDV